MKTTHSRVFLIENGAAKDSLPVRKLVDEELIHQVPSAVAPREVRNRLKMFNIDYGNYVDWLASRKESIDEVIEETVIPSLPDDFAENLDKYTLVVTDIGSKRRECPHCGQWFSRDQPVYELLRRCPHCAQEVGAEP